MQSTREVRKDGLGTELRCSWKDATGTSSAVGRCSFLALMPDAHACQHTGHVGLFEFAPSFGSCDADLAGLSAKASRPNRNLLADAYYVRWAGAPHVPHTLAGISDQLAAGRMLAPACNLAQPLHLFASTHSCGNCASAPHGQPSLSHSCTPPLSLADPVQYAGQFGSRGDDPSQFTQLLQGLTVASPADGGAVYIVDCSPTDDGSSPCSVKVFSRDGDYLRTIGGPGQGPGQVRAVRARGGRACHIGQHRTPPRGVLCTSSLLGPLVNLHFECDPANACQPCPLLPSLVATAQFLFASGLAVLGGRLYVSDISTEQPRVSVFNATTGAYLFAFGTPGSGGGQMAEPYALTTSGGMLYVVDRNLNRVTVFDGQGK